LNSHLYEFSRESESYSYGYSRDGRHTLPVSRKDMPREVVLGDPDGTSARATRERGRAVSRSSFYALPCLAVIFRSQQNDTGKMLELWFFTELQSWRECFSTQSAFGASLYRFASSPRSVGNELGSADSLDARLKYVQPRKAAISTHYLYEHDVESRLPFKISCRLPEGGVRRRERISIYSDGLIGDSRRNREAPRQPCEASSVITRRR
jgi:hypothetical protein